MAKGEHQDCSYIEYAVTAVGDRLVMTPVGLPGIKIEVCTTPESCSVRGACPVCERFIKKHRDQDRTAERRAKIRFLGR